MSAPADIEWDRGRARVLPLGAMLTDLTVRMRDGREVEPLYTAPWLSEADCPTKPPLLGALQGEWPCVPFGAAPNGALREPWAGVSHAEDAWPHGFGANHVWTLETDETGHAVSARIDYPTDGPVMTLSRRVAARDGSPAIDLSLTITVHREIALPIGLHPTLRLPETPGMARLDPGAYREIWCYPADSGAAPIIPYRTPFRPGDLAASLLDMFSLPYATGSETLLLLTGTEGHAALDNLEERYRVEITWDARIFPSLLLWISNRGRPGPPWNGRNLALGVEPVCAAFDLGCAASRAENPLTRQGTPTTVNIHPDRPLHTDYSVVVKPLQP